MQVTKCYVIMFLFSETKCKCSGEYDPAEIHNAGMIKRHMLQVCSHLAWQMVSFFLYLYWWVPPNVLPPSSLYPACWTPWCPRTWSCPWTTTWQCWDSRPTPSTTPTLLLTTTTLQSLTGTTTSDQISNSVQTEILNVASHNLYGDQFICQLD